MEPVQFTQCFPFNVDVPPFHDEEAFTDKTIKWKFTLYGALLSHTSYPLLSAIYQIQGQCHIQMCLGIREFKACMHACIFVIISFAF